MPLTPNYRPTATEICIPFRRLLIATSAAICHLLGPTQGFRPAFIAELVPAGASVLGDFAEKREPPCFHRLNMICKFYNIKECLLLTHISGKRNFIPLGYCESRCGPNDIEKQKSMLATRGYLVRDIPDDLSHLAAVKTSSLTAQVAMAVDELPGALSMIRNLGKHALTVVDHYKKTGRVFVNGTQQAERLKICEACEHYTLDDRGSPRCKQASCGCHLSGEIGKTRFEALPCPIGKHDALDKTYRED